MGDDADWAGNSGKPYLVIGIFGGENRVPKEQMIRIKHSRWLFWNIWFNVVLLRGHDACLSTMVILLTTKVLKNDGALGSFKVSSGLVMAL
jgi:hypothetical protein